MKYIKKFETIIEDDNNRIVTLFKRFHVLGEDFEYMIESVRFLKTENIDYEICYRTTEGTYGQILYLVYAFIKGSEYDKRNLLDGELFFLDTSTNRFFEKTTDLNTIKEHLFNQEYWKFINKDDFDVRINANTYNL